jgi:hypothetical protein
MTKGIEKPPLDVSIERFIGKLEGNSITASYGRYVAREAINHMANYFSHAEDRKTKEYAQRLARSKWKAQPDETIPDMTDTVHEILKLEGKQYAKSTVRIWVSKVAPPQAHKPGRRPTK